MAERYFRNEMPDFIPEAESTLQNYQTHNIVSDSLTNLLNLPYNALVHNLKTSALHLKQLVVQHTWTSTEKPVDDYTLYTGALGTAFLLFKSYQVTNDKDDLRLCSDIVRACHSASTASRRVTFLCGQAGVCALGAVAAVHNGDKQLVDYYLSQFREIKLPKDLPNELLYGRSGFLWACSFIYKHTGIEAISPTQMRAVVSDIIHCGRRLAEGSCPLMYEWHGKRYWGAAHGLAGIMHVLLDMELTADQLEDVKRTLQYMIRNRFPSGNYPSSEGSESDRLVHWCHGAPGVALTLVKAAKLFTDEEFKQAAIDAGEVVWKRGLLKRVGICHGISGNAYVFLSLYQLTGSMQYLYKAKAFACFLLDRAQNLISKGIMHGGDSPYSLFEGIGGMTYLFLDMIEPSSARFPAYEL